MELELESYLKFVREVLDRHSMMVKDRKELDRAIKLIQKKIKDKKLYLGIVGEFSSGKSTLINALLKYELLRTDVIQETTSSATILTYGKNPDVIVKFKDGRLKTFKDTSLSFWARLWGLVFGRNFSKQKKDMIKFLHSVTAEEELAKEVENVTVCYPSIALQEGLVIVDTPGANVENERHVEVTSKAIRHLCDAAVVVVPANVPVSQSLVEFLRINLQQELHRCIFLVTKIDLIRRARERELLIKNIQKRLEMELNLKDPIVLPIAPLVITDDIDDDALRKQFELAEGLLYQTMREQRKIIQIEKTTNLLTMLFSQLEEHLRALEKSYVARHEELEKNKITDLVSFVQAEKTKYSGNIVDGFRAINLEVSNFIREAEQKLISDLKQAINDAEDEEALQQVVTSTVSRLMTKAQNQVNLRMNTIINRIRNLGVKELEGFESRFQELYRSLATLGGEVAATSDRIKPSGIKTIVGDFKDQAQSVNEMMLDDQNKEKLFTYGGAGVGAAVGTAILPVIGTAIGGAVGWLAGVLFKPSIGKLREKYLAELQPAIRKSFQETENLILNNITLSHSQMVTNLNTIIDKYFKKYNSLVEEMIARDEVEAMELLELQFRVNKDLRQLQERQKQLTEAREELRSFSYSPEVEE